MSMSSYTIDDSAWNTPLLSLSPGWNMLRNDSAEYISEDEVMIMRPLLPEFFNASYSWNTHAGCSNTLFFTGSEITAYGLAGPRSGNFSVIVDGQTTLHSALAGDADYAHVLFTIDNLNAGANHSMTMTNLEDGKWFGFDYALITTDPSPIPGPAPLTSGETSAPHADAGAPVPFTFPDALKAPLQMMMAGQPTPEQMALLKPYEYHWTAGGYFTISIVAVSVACLYIFFLFQFGMMLRDKHVKENGNDHPESDNPTAANTMMNQNNKRSSWSSRGSGRTRPTTRVMQALRNKKISAPSPIPEEYDDYENGTGKNSPGSSESGMDYSTAEGSGSGSGGHGTMPRLAFDEDMRPPRRLGELF